jgi:hypothetical protein
MPTLTINTTANQAQRVAAAFGKQHNTRDASGNPRPATAEEVKEQVIQFLKQAVLSQERSAAAQSAESAITEMDLT